MEELSAVGEQVFDAECILNKRFKKVRRSVWLVGWFVIVLLLFC